MDDNKIKNENLDEEIQDTEEEVVVKDESKDEIIESLKKELEEERNLRLRALADYQNMKARAAKEKDDLIAFTQTTLLLKLLDLADDFKNIIDHKVEGAEDDGWYKGVMMVYEKLMGIIETEGIEEIETKENDKFDHNFHEAIGFVTITNDEENQKISKVVSKGYRKKDQGRVIRTAKVIVNKVQ